jgi:hypothetical protein
MIRSMLDGAPVAAPPTLLDTYRDVLGPYAVAQSPG